MQKESMIAVDDSGHSRNAVRYAIDLYHAVKDVKFTIIHVQATISQYLMDEAPKKPKAYAELEKVHKEVSLRLTELENSVFAEPIKWRFDQLLPTIGDYVTFMCITHEAMHLGQLSAWRRAAKLESSLARL